MCVSDIFVADLCDTISNRHAGLFLTVICGSFQGFLLLLTMYQVLLLLYDLPNPTLSNPGSVVDYTACGFGSTKT